MLAAQYFAKASKISYILLNTVSLCSSRVLAKIIVILYGVKKERLCTKMLPRPKQTTIGC